MSFPPVWGDPPSFLREGSLLREGGVLPTWRASRWWVARRSSAPIVPEEDGTLGVRVRLSEDCQYDGPAMVCR